MVLICGEFLHAKCFITANNCSQSVLSSAGGPVTAVLQTVWTLPCLAHTSLYRRMATPFKRLRLREVK